MEKAVKPVTKCKAANNIVPFVPSPMAYDNDIYRSSGLSDAIDRTLHASAAKFTGGLSPIALLGAYADWAQHLMFSPGKQVELIEKIARKTTKLAHYTCNCTDFRKTENSDGPCIEPLPQDRRFTGQAWQKWPYNIIYQSFLLNQQWWYNATTGIRGVTQQHENVMEFSTRQILDIFSPSNFFMTNPEVIERTIEEKGKNLLRGLQNYRDDMADLMNGTKPKSETYKVGQNIAATKGKVIFQNRLMELIQYESCTDSVRPEPILIVPAWIMKYYILDLSPHNSLVKYLTEQGYTVFMISWKNPDENDRDLGMDDYRQMGVMEALDVMSKIIPNEKIHTAGYCLGGTLLSIAASAMARDGDDRLASITLFAAQTDFTEAGELSLFINDSQLVFLEDMMWEKGFLDTHKMSGTFQLLQSNDLIWSRMVRNYMMGERRDETDLMVWNSDTTRMPYRMHSEYLRQLFLNNALATGQFKVGEQPVMLSDIRQPIFAVGTVRDHVAPWRSVYKIHQLLDTEVTFVLTSGGHNAGIVSEIGHKGRHYQIKTKTSESQYQDPDSWLKETPEHDGSWWSAWINWLDERSGQSVAPPSMGNPKAGLRPLADAPGHYVFQN
ncbi:MAG: alpha/beta fold hydrolase [Emcibacter sp.]|nr:alpha/beta fold hydrolase [Emcibacter sp.]